MLIGPIFSTFGPQICDPNWRKTVQPHCVNKLLQETKMQPLFKTLTQSHYDSEWTENAEMLFHLKDDIKPPPAIKPKKSYKVNITVNEFSNSLGALPQQKKIQELCGGISTQGYVIVTLQWSHIINKHLHDS